MTMLETIDLDAKLDRDVYQEKFPWIKTGLRELQHRARELKIPIVIVFEGWDTAGKGDAIQHVTEVLDPRGFDVHYINLPTEEEKQYPWMRRYWTKLPGRGRVGFFERSWYNRVLQQRVESHLTDDEVEATYDEIKRFEKQLIDDNHIIIKFWFHLSKKQQRKRLKAAEEDVFRRFTVTQVEWRHHSNYEDYLEAVEEMISRTQTKDAPWNVVPAANGRYRRMQTLQIISETLEREIAARELELLKPSKKIEFPPTISETTPRKELPLSRADLTKTLSENEYDERLGKAQIKLRQLQKKLYTRKVPVTIVYEGWDAAGKGGNIKRILKALDPRGYRVIPISAPTRIELAHQYLWRFWNSLPPSGEIGIFDRSWYGRVMVERIEGFCTENEWRRAYQEIRDFEKELLNYGTILIKFWLHISKEEQLQRFEARANNPHKQWKLTEEDWRNRDKWDRYEHAVNDMILETSTKEAPWTIIAANDKRHARVKGIETVCAAIEKALDLNDDA